MNYTVVDFLAERVVTVWRVFEYGAGASTAWWAKRVALVTACEHNENWYCQQKDACPANVKLLHVPLDVDGAYCRVILERHLPSAIRQDYDRFIHMEGEVGQLSEHKAWVESASERSWLINLAMITICALLPCRGGRTGGSA